MRRLFQSYVSVSFAADDSNLLQLTVGQITKAKVTAVSESGVLCELENKVKGFVTLEHMPGKWFFV